MSNQPYLHDLSDRVLLSLLTRDRDSAACRGLAHELADLSDALANTYLDLLMLASERGTFEAFAVKVRQAT